jgi:hypothetical protein
LNFNSSFKVVEYEGGQNSSDEDDQSKKENAAPRSLPPLPSRKQSAANRNSYKHLPPLTNGARRSPSPNYVMAKPKQVLQVKADFNSRTPFYMGDTLKTSADREFQKLRNTEQSSFDKGSDYGS